MFNTYKINHTSKKLDWVVFQSVKLKSHFKVMVEIYSHVLQISINMIMLICFFQRNPSTIIHTQSFSMSTTFSAISCFIILINQRNWLCNIFTHAHTNATIKHSNKTKLINHASNSPPTLKLDIVLNVQKIKTSKRIRERPWV